MFLLGNLSSQFLVDYLLEHIERLRSDHGEPVDKKCRRGAYAEIERKIAVRFDGGLVLVTIDACLEFIDIQAEFARILGIYIASQTAAAACFLPLSMNPALARSLGTRHRAAIGITEETDCLALIVSEQTGGVSVAAFG